MSTHDSQKSSKYLLWPIFVLIFLTIGVFITTNEIPKQQEVRSRAQVFQNPSLFPSGFANDIPSPTPKNLSYAFSESISQNNTAEPIRAIALPLIFVVITFFCVLFIGKKILFLYKKSRYEYKEYYIKQSGQDDQGIWLSLSDDAGQKVGLYHGNDLKEGFGYIKGTLKTVDGKEFIEISKILWEKPA